MRKPDVSIIIPAKNASLTLEKTLNSVKDQSFSNWEAIIVDDCSSDGTLHVIKQFCSKDKRFQFLEGSGQGPGSARNLGMSKATGKWLHFLDADDWNDKRFLTLMLKALEKNTDSRVAYCGHQRVLPTGLLSPTYTPGAAIDAFEQFARRCTIAIHSIVVDRELILSLGGFDISLKSCEDWDLWQRVSRVQRNWTQIKRVLSYYRMNQHSLSRNIKWLFTNSLQVIDRGFRADPRLGHLSSESAINPSVEEGSIEKAFFYNSTWIVGLECGSGQTPSLDCCYFPNFEHLNLNADNLANIMIDGLIAGTLSKPSALAERWSDYQAGLKIFFSQLAICIDDQHVPNAIQYHLERKIAELAKPLGYLEMHKTIAVAMAVNRLFEIKKMPNIDRFHIRLMVGKFAVAAINLGNLGTINANYIRDAICLFKAPRYHFTIKTVLYLKNRDSAVDCFKAMARDTRWLFKYLLFSLIKNCLQLAFRRSNIVTKIELNEHEWAVQNLIDDAHLYAEQNIEARQNNMVKAFQEDAVDHSNRKTHFEKLFQTEDPWKYDSDYETEKYLRQIEILPTKPILSALELACAEGHFTVRLADHVETLVATDISNTALCRAQIRCSTKANVIFQPLDFSSDVIPGDMDLIVCSEVLYYLKDVRELKRVAQRIARSLRVNGSLVTAHAYLLRENPTRGGFDWDCVYGADTIRKIFESIPGLILEKSIDTELYRIDRYRRVASKSGKAISTCETKPITAKLEKNVGRYAVRGGAKARRVDVKWEQRTCLPILMYHSISEDGPEKLRRYRLRPADFEAQLQWLRSHGYHSVGLEEVAWHCRTNTTFSGRPVMLTFDDGLQDFADIAWPLLSQYDFLAEVFIVTGQVGKIARWDSDKGDPGKLMSSETIIGLASEGVKFGSHLVSHTPVDGLSTIELAQELINSRELLARWLGQPPTGYAAPYSISDTRLTQLARESGYQVGFGFQSGFASIRDDLFDLPRIEIVGTQPHDYFVSIMQSVL